MKLIFNMQRQKITAIEVKGGRGKGALPGMEAFGKTVKNCKKLLVGEDGLLLDGFFRTEAVKFLD